MTGGIYLIDFKSILSHRYIMCAIKTFNKRLKMLPKIKFMIVNLVCRLEFY